MAGAWRPGGGAHDRGGTHGTTCAPGSRTYLARRHPSPARLLIPLPHPPGLTASLIPPPSPRLHPRQLVAELARLAHLSSDRREAERGRPPHRARLRTYVRTYGDAESSTYVHRTGTPGTPGTPCATEPTARCAALVKRFFFPCTADVLGGTATTGTPGTVEQLRHPAHLQGNPRVRTARQGHLAPVVRLG